MELEEKLQYYRKRRKIVPSKNMIKTPKQIEGIRRAGRVNKEILDAVDELVRPGISTEDINQLVHKKTLELGGIPAPLGFEGYPKSVCTSINDVICHGIPSEEEILAEGDILNVDVTTIVDGYYGDASRMYCIGQVADEAGRLVRITKECLDLSLNEVKPESCLGNIGAVISAHARAAGFSVVRDICGHGVGLDFHERPYICHVGKRNTGMILFPGMIFTIEPMINAGRQDWFVDEDDGWTIYTDDGSLSAQWEYTVLVTEEGYEVLSS
ncbi:type I methionyl aminopeptidase [Lachnospiraceae bacterium 62-35]